MECFQQADCRLQAQIKLREEHRLQLAAKTRQPGPGLHPRVRVVIGLRRREQRLLVRFAQVVKALFKQ